MNGPTKWFENLPPAQKKQFWLGGIIVALLLFGVVITASMTSAVETTVGNRQGKAVEVNLTPAKVNMNEVNRRSSSKKLAENSKDIEQLKKSDEEMLERFTPPTMGFGVKSPKPPKVSASPSLPPLSVSPHNSSVGLRTTAVKTAPPERSKPVDSIHVWKPERQSKKDVQPKRTILMGVAPATLITSADVGTKVAAKSNPKRVLISITDKGFFSRNNSADMAGCLITADVWGEISSERAMLVLDKIQCASPGVLPMLGEAGTFTRRGKLLEGKLNGWVVDNYSAKSGLVGEVVWKADKVLGHTAAAAFLEGAAKSIAATSTASTTTLPAGSIFSAATSATDALRSGVAGGASGAANKLAEIYAGIAEQYEPFISVAAGQEISIIFGDKIELKETEICLDMNSGWQDCKKLEVKTEW